MTIEVLYLYLSLFALAFVTGTFFFIDFKYRKLIKMMVADIEGQSKFITFLVQRNSKIQNDNDILKRQIYTQNKEVTQ